MSTTVDYGVIITEDGQGGYRVFFPETLTTLIKRLDGEELETTLTSIFNQLASKADISIPVPFITVAGAANAITASKTGVNQSIGTQLTLKLAATNTTTAVTLAFNGNPAVAIKNKGADPTIGMLQQGMIITVRYDGTYWQIEDNDLTGNLVPTTAGTGAAYTLAHPSIKALVTGVLIPVKFATANTSTTPTIDISSTGAKTIKKNGNALAVGEIPANSYSFLIWDGTNYQLVGTKDIMCDSKIVNFTSTADTGDVANNDTMNTMINKLQNKISSISTSLGGAVLSNTSVESRVVALAIEVALLKGAALFGMGDNMFIDTLANANDITITKGTYSSTTKKITA